MNYRNYNKKINMKYHILAGKQTNNNDNENESGQSSGMINSNCN